MSMAETRSITYATAINEALREEMRRDKTVLLIGEDVAAFGGVFKVTDGLLAEFGPERVMDTPISEAGITGLGVGAAMSPTLEDVTLPTNDKVVRAARAVMG